MQSYIVVQYGFSDHVKLGLVQVPFLFGVPAFEKAATLVIHLIFRRTGQHLFLVDNDQGKPPLLERMIKDDGDCYFMYVLASLLLYEASE